MLFERFTHTQVFASALVLVLLVTACGQRPPIETTILPGAAESPTAFLVAAPDGATAAPDAAPNDPAAISTSVSALPATAAGDTPVPAASPTPAVFGTAVPPADTNATITPAPSSTTVAMAQLTATVTVTASSSITTTAAPTCFGSINGSVVADLNKNGQAEAGEPGVLGAKLFLYNASGVVGLYTTGNGQFYFPGLVGGKYTLTAAPPIGYTPGGPPSYELDVNCDQTITQNILLIPSTASGPGSTPAKQAANATGSATRTPTPASKSKITPVAAQAGTPRASKSGTGASNFKPFQVSAVYDIGGCGAVTSPGLYRLAQSLTSQWDCIQIYSDNVIFDCQGNSLNGTDLNGYGIVVHQIGNILTQRPARNIEIRDCKIARHKYGIFIDAADNLYVHDNVLSDNFRDTDERNFGQFLGLTEGGGIRVGSTTNALIAENRTDRNAIGIDVRTGGGITVRGNIANENTAWGVHFYNVQFSEISNNTASDNLRYCTWGNGTVGPGCDAGGIMLQAGSSKNVVRDNMISGSNGNGIFIKAHGTPCGDGNVIQNNTVTGALYNAIELSFCRDNRIAGNHIQGSLDGIWLGFATNNTINGGNDLRDLGNHGIISWNSSNNNISTNTIVNSREGLYFYSSDYDREQFFFVQGSPDDHISTGNCLCDNTLVANATAAIHLNNSLKNQITNNKLTNNGINFVMEGNTAGNIIQDNEIQGGAYRYDAPRASYAAFSNRPGALTAASFASFSNRPTALTAYDMAGRVLSPADFRRAILADATGDSFDLHWFKLKLRISLFSR